MEFGPRYSPPVDNTMIMNIFHGTMDAGISILMDHEAVAKLLAWLSADVDFWLGTIEFPDLQTSAELARRIHSMTGEEIVDVRITWHGSRRARVYHLTPRQREATVEFLRAALEDGWEGWLAPADVHPMYHGHVTTNGVKAPCKLCDLRAAKA
jgi:hypothetical protein